MILGWAKNLNMKPSEVLYDVSYENLLLYSKATPCYDDVKDDWDDSIDANDPGNFNKKQDNDEEEVFVR